MGDEASEDEEVWDFALHECLESVTEMTVKIYLDREDQYRVPTFVHAASFVLKDLYKKGGLHLKENYTQADTENFIGQLHVLQIVLSLIAANQRPEVIKQWINAVEQHYLLPKEVRTHWHEMVDTFAASRNFTGLVSSFDTAMRGGFRIWGADASQRLNNWIELLKDIMNAADRLSEYPNWRNELERVLDRCAQRAKGG